MSPNPSPPGTTAAEQEVPLQAAPGGMHDLLRRLFPICRSITGDGVRETLRILQEFLPDLKMIEVPTGTQCFDWQVPEEWNITEARLMAPDGRIIADFAVSNLHVVSYSEPVDLELSLEELQPHLHSEPNQPDAIPYVTSYYKRNWGFCIPHRVREALQPGQYRAVIRSTLKPGHLTYGELVIPGSTSQEVLLSTYICHPSLANNELSGPVVATWLGRFVQSLPDRRLTYRILFIPETIGAIVYLSRHLEHLKKHVIAGYVLSCVGDDRAYSYLASRLGNTLADKVARHVLDHLHPEYVKYSYLRRGSDERQFCWPGVDLPVCSVMRTRYGIYPEYHTSLDDLSLVTETGLQGTFNVLKHCLLCLEHAVSHTATVLCEPQLGRRQLYPTTARRGRAAGSRILLDILAYSDGDHDLIDIANLLGRPAWELFPIFQTLQEHQLLKPASVPLPEPETEVKTRLAASPAALSKPRTHYATGDLVDTYHWLGLKEGDTVYVTGNLGDFGFHESRTKTGTLGAHLQALREVIGENGTLVSPTHSFSLCNTDRVFDPLTTPSERGPLTEYLRTQSGSVRQFHPFASVTAWGAQAERICGGCTRHAYGPQTPFDRMIQRDAWFLSLGMPPQHTCSIVHHVEMLMGVPYRYTKEFMHPVQRDGVCTEEPFYQFVTYREADLVRDRNEKIFQHPRLQDNLRHRRVGLGQVWAYRMQAFHEAATDLLTRDIYTWLKQPPGSRPYRQ